MNQSPYSPEILVAAALEARQRAYAPYSHYLVGAAVLVADGTIITWLQCGKCILSGDNLCRTGCADAAIAQGYRDFIAIAVATVNGGTPCGICRQVMAELGQRW